MGFRLIGLPSGHFRHLAFLSDAELKERSVLRLSAEPGFPCRVTLRDADVGAPVLLLHYYHHGVVSSPYRSSGPIFVSEGNNETAVFENDIPGEMRERVYSARSYGADGFMVDGRLATGTELEELLEQMLRPERVEFIHLHHARRGCFACRVERQ